MSAMTATQDGKIKDRLNRAESRAGEKGFTM
jgi:hypothetical protein